MRLTKREQELLSLLREGPRTGSELAELLGVSRRTVMREVALVNAQVESSGACRVVSTELGYELRVDSEEALGALMDEGLSDELVVLLVALTSPTTSLSNLAQETFLSRRALAAAIAGANGALAGVVSLEPRAGRGVEVRLPVMGAADLLAALAAENRALTSRLADACAWARLEPLVSPRVSAYLDATAPYLSARQARLQALGALAAAPRTAGEGCTSGDRVRAVTRMFEAKRVLLDELLTDRDWVTRLIAGLLDSYGVTVTRDDLSDLIFDHVVRCAVFPTVTSPEMRSEMRDLRLHHPFEFDFADELTARLRERVPRLVMEPEFIALYVLAYVDERPTEPVSILMLSNRRSTSTINQQLIERNVENAEVSVAADGASAARAIEARDWDLVVRDEDCQVPAGGASWDVTYCGVLDTRRLAEIRRLALDALYSKSVPRMLGPGGFVTLEGVREGMPYLEAFDAVASLLANLRLITSDEASLLRDRERAGERLNTAGVALPHAVTPVKSPTFRLVVVRPSAPVMDGDERIELVLVVLASKGQLDKSSVFPYLVSRIGDARSRGDELPTDLDSAIRFLGGRPGRFA